MSSFKADEILSYINALDGALKNGQLTDDQVKCLSILMGAFQTALSMGMGMDLTIGVTEDDAQA